MTRHKKTVKVISRNNMTFYIFDDYVVIENSHLQHTCYDKYGEMIKDTTKTFRDAVEALARSQLHTITDVVNLSNEYGIYGRYTRKPDLTGYKIIRLA